jgi:glycosyltransferase involved in cell wall biosynthesis
VLLYPTEWAASSAVRDFAADPAKILVAPYGANIEKPPDAAEIEAAIGLKPSRGGIKLILIGVNWREKGCDIAVDCLRDLRDRGVDATLTIVGCAPPEAIDQPGLTVIPFLDKSRPDEAARFRGLLLDADLLILPTRNECFGIALCEACAFGLPIIAADTGGVAEIVREGENGFTLPLAAGGAPYAEAVTNLLADRDAWAAMARRSRALYESDYNWDVWGRRNRDFIRARLGI